MIDKISRKIGINLHYFISRGFWVSGRFFTVTILTLLISVAFARLTSKDTFGQYQYIISLASLLSVFSLPGLNTAALRAFVEGDEQSIEQSVRYSFLFSLIATSILVSIGLYKYFHSEQLLGLSIGAAGLLLPFFYAPNNWYVYYEGKLNFKSSTLRLILLNTVLLVGMVVGLQLKFNLFGLILLYFGINGLLTTTFYFEARQKIKAQNKDTKLSLPYALKCTVQKFTTTIGENIQTIAVSAIFGFANLAIYQVAQSFVNAFVGLTGTLASTYFPLLLKYKRLNHNLIIVQHLILGLIFWVIYSVAVRFLFAPLYGAHYQMAIDLAYRLSFIIIFLPLRVYVTNFFTARDNNRVIISTNIAASLIALVLFFFSRQQGFFQSAVIYLYALNILMIAPLFFIYIRTANQENEDQGVSR